MLQSGFTLASSLCVLLLTIAASHGAPTITEFMAENDSRLKDEDGAYSDWIEIYNPDSAAVSLAGYHLTDNGANLDQWTFPAVTLAPGAYLVVFASGKDRAEPAGQLHTDFSLSSSGEYLALVAPDGVTVLSSFGIGYPEQFENVSYGLDLTASPAALSYFSTPTPGAANGVGTRVGPIFTIADRNPPQPTGGPLRITATLRPANDPVAEATLYYRRMFAAETALPMRDDGQEGDVTASDGIWTATIPATAFAPGEMTRWRFVAKDTRGTEAKEPSYRAPLDSHQYYGTVTSDPEVQSLLPVLHWFTSNAPGAGTSTGSRGAVYYNGELYDNVLFNLHGQSTAGFPKKSYNIDFNRTQRFRWRNDAPRVADIDLLTNWADKSKVRQVLGYEVMRDSGVAAHFAHTVRVEQNGNFFSTADFVEDADEIYLERAGLNPEGALYKVYSNLLNRDAGNTATTGVEKKTRKFENNSDLQALINGLDLVGTELTTYLYDQIDLPRCVNMLAANSVIRNIDMHSKNWYIYRDTGRSGEWAILPWDLDLSHGRVWNTQFNYFDNGLYSDGYILTGTSVRLVSHLFANPAIRSMIMRRIRTLTDRFLQAPGTPEAERYYERRLDEQSRMIDPGSIVPSDAQRDFQKWGSWLQGGTTVPYSNTNVAVESMAEAVQRWKTQYLPARRNYVYNTQVVGKGGEIPLPQTYNSAGQETLRQPTISIGAIEPSPVSGNQDEEYIQLLNTNRIAVDVSDWRLVGGVEHRFAAGTVIPANGALYVCPNAAAFRARTVSPKGGERLFVQGGYAGHLSNFGESITLLDAAGNTNSTKTYQGEPTPLQKFLVVSEVMYHPAVNELAEFVELMNVSTNTTLDLRGARFTQGIQFDFSTAGILSLAPGERLLVVRDLQNFRATYGTNLPVAGVFTNGSALSNDGEPIKLEDAANNTISEFSYLDQAPWPALADGSGPSLELISPETNPDPSLAVNWRASARAGGTPGRAELSGFSGDPMGDSNHNGERDLIDYALGNDLGLPLIPTQISLQTGQAGAGPGLLLIHPVSLTASNVTVAVFYSRDLNSWQDASPHLELVSRTPAANGREMVTWRIAAPLNAEPRVYLRIRVVAQ